MRMTPSRLALLHRFQSDERAVSAVEFALIAPLLIFLLLASFDVTRAVDAKTKSTQLASTVADFVSQYQGGVTQTELANIIAASKFILYPYPDTPDVLTVNIESINRVSETPLEYEIDWSYPPANTTNRETTEGTDVSSIRADVTNTYKLKFAGYLTSRLGFSELTLKSSTNVSPRYPNPIVARW